MWRLNRNAWRWMVPAVTVPLLSVLLLLRPGDTGLGFPGIDAPDDRALAEAVLREPERFTQSTGVTAAGGAHRPPEPSRPLLLSQVQCPAPPVKQAAPVALEKSRFHREFTSIRATEVRDPDSAENRAGVSALMVARQQRLGQIDPRDRTEGRP